MIFYLLRISGGDFSSELKQSDGTLGCNKAPGPSLSYSRWGWDLSYQQLIQGLNPTFLSLPQWELLLSVPRYSVLQDAELCSPGARWHWSCCLLDPAALGCARRAAPTCPGDAQALQKAQKLSPHFLCQVCLSLCLHLPGIIGSPGAALLIITSKYLFKV